MGWYCDMEVRFDGNTELARRIKEICEKKDLVRYNVFNEFFPLPEELSFYRNAENQANSDDFVSELDRIWPCSKEKLKMEYEKQMERIRRDFSSAATTSTHGYFFSRDELARERIPLLLENLRKGYEMILRTGYSSWYPFMMKHWGCTGCEEQSWEMDGDEFIFRLATYKSNGLAGICNISRLYPDMEFRFRNVCDMDPDDVETGTIIAGVLTDDQ